jgi:integrase
VGALQLFLRRPGGCGEPLSASVNAAAETAPTLRAKHVTPHSFRHAIAVHLVSAGVDISPGQSANEAEGARTGRRPDAGQRTAVVEAGRKHTRLARHALK